MSFADDMKTFVLKIQSKEASVITEIRKRVSESIINKTPVDNINPGDGGQAKASWVATVGSQGQSNHSDRDKTGDDTKARVNAVAHTNINSDFYLTSTCPYIGVLEYGEYPNPPKKGTYLKAGQTKDGVTGPGYNIFSEGGFSSQAPHGMVRVTVADFQNIVNDVVKDLK